MARSTKHKLKKTVAALVDLAAGPGTARTIKGKAKQLAGTGASWLARAAAAAAVRLEAEGKADAIAGRLEAEAGRALKQTRQAEVYRPSASGRRAARREEVVRPRTIGIDDDERLESVIVDRQCDSS